MKVEFEIDDETLVEPVKKAAAIAINEVVRRKVDERIRAVNDTVDETVSKYLDKYLDENKIKRLIDQSALEMIKDKLRFD